MWTKQAMSDPHFTRCKGCHRLICVIKTSMLHAHNEQDLNGYKWHFVLCKSKYGRQTIERLRLNKWI